MPLHVKLSEVGLPDLLVVAVGVVLLWGVNRLSRDSPGVSRCRCAGFFVGSSLDLGIDVRLFTTRVGDEHDGKVPEATGCGK